MKSGHARWAVPLAIGWCAVAVTYAIMRAVQAWFFPSPDPRTVMMVTKIAFFWRGSISAYAGVLVTLGALALRRRDPEWLDAQLPRIATATIVIATLQGLLVP